MIKFVISLSIFILQFTTLIGWQENWENAVKCCEVKNYCDAENYFAESIRQLQESGNINHPHVYVDRARLYQLLEKNNDALSDLNMAIDSENLDANDLVRALTARTIIYAKLGFTNECMNDIQQLKIVDINAPKVSVSDNNVIIRNVPDCECYRNIIINTSVQLGICEKREDVNFLNSNICIIKKKKDCNCGCNDTNQPKLQKNTNLIIPKDFNINDCKGRCDSLATIGIVSCGKWFKSIRCQSACIYAVDYIKGWCHNCCASGNFYKKCVEPYSYIQDYIKAPCDPAWD